MYAVEFEASIKNGTLTIPLEYQEIRQSDSVKVILMINENKVKPIEKKRELNAISLDMI